MKIVNIQEEGRFAGPHRQMIDLATSLSTDKVEMELFFPQQDTEILRRQLEKSDAKARLLPLNRLSKEPKALWNYIRYFMTDVRLLKEHLKELSPDIVQCNGSQQFKGVLAAGSLGLPIVWHLTDAKMPLIIRFIFNKLRKKYVENFISASNKTAKYYIGSELNTKNLDVIQSPIDFTKFDPSQVSSEEYWQDFEHDFKVVSVGNVTPVKGYERILKIAKMLRDRNIEDVKFVIIGRVWNSQKKYFDRLNGKCIEDNLSNVQFIPGADNIAQWLKGADLYFCSSDSESSPIAIWEAMAMQLPVISTNVGDVEQIVDNNQAGFVHGHEEYDQFMESIIRLKNDRELRSKLAIESRTVAKKLFDKKIIAEQHEAVYSRIIHG